MHDEGRPSSIMVQCTRGLVVGTVLLLSSQRPPADPLSEAHALVRVSHNRAHGGGWVGADICRSGRRCTPLAPPCGARR
jgi:hypothetical protein